MEVRGEPGELRRALGMPELPPVLSLRCSGVEYLAQVSLCGNSPSRGVLPKSRVGFFLERLLFVGEVCKKRPARTVQPQRCCGVGCGVKSHLAGLWVRSHSWAGSSGSAGDAAPGLSGDRGLSGRWNV